ncbi:Ankyrin 2,3/unc44 [Collimonas arenae]|uniref:Ankyrin 2,3/unc44 n=1 Tax=Collimonas arenae TaxID=279058 RepID=A0A0A1F6S1_9BURK|nr:ankyrin repeat domain-containing protein [Collimonas arenae]AIY39369.1 Ankyrin 2,3/unc44 [Collimonas arenae]
MKLIHFFSVLYFTFFTAIILALPIPSFATVSVPENFYPCDEFKDFSSNKRALYEAVKSNNADIALNILPTVGDVNYCTPAMDLRVVDLAIIHRNVLLVKHLLEKGAEVNCVGNCRSAILYVIDQPNADEKEEDRAIEIGDILLKHGASLEHLNFAPLLDSAAPMGRQCPSVVCAARNGNIKTIKWLSKHGAAINSEDAQSRTPLIFAVVRGDITTAKILLDLGANPNGLHENSNGFGSPLIHAAAMGYPEMTILLISRGANVNQTIRSGIDTVTPLKWAHKCGDGPDAKDELVQRCKAVAEILSNAGEKE